MSFFPAPNRPGNPLTGTGNFIAALAAPLNADQYTVRVDHNITPTQHVFGRWSQKRQFIQGTGPFYGVDNPAGMGIKEQNPRWDIGLGPAEEPCIAITSVRPSPSKSPNSTDGKAEVREVSVAEIVAGACLDALVPVGTLGSGFTTFANTYQVIPNLEIGF